jgi:RimJ/RimL family protein N-acetyltransferase
MHSRAVRIEPAGGDAGGAMFRERDAWRYDPPYDLYDGDALFYGFGLRPDLTGRGLGEQFVLAGLDYARGLGTWHRVVLDVAAFNERAIRLYRRLGFTETGRYTATVGRHGAIDFIEMEMPAPG